MREELAVPIVLRSYLRVAVTGSTTQSIVAEPHIGIRGQRTVLEARPEEIRLETGRRTHASRLAAKAATWPAIGVVARESVIGLRGLEAAIVQGAQV